jgi:hypothetical protein
MLILNILCRTFSLWTMVKIYPKEALLVLHHTLSAAWYHRIPRVLRMGHIQTQPSLLKSHVFSTLPAMWAHEVQTETALPHVVYLSRPRTSVGTFWRSWLLPLGTLLLGCWLCPYRIRGGTFLCHSYQHWYSHIGDKTKHLWQSRYLGLKFEIELPSSFDWTSITH